MTSRHADECSGPPIGVPCLDSTRLQLAATAPRVPVTHPPDPSRQRLREPRRAEPSQAGLSHRPPRTLTGSCLRSSTPAPARLLVAERPPTPLPAAGRRGQAQPPGRAECRGGQRQRHQREPGRRSHPAGAQRRPHEQQHPPAAMARPAQNRTGRSHLLIMDSRTHRAAAILPGRREEAMRSRDKPYQDSVVAHRPSLYDHSPAFRGRSGSPPR
jgi:hypothetical protein